MDERCGGYDPETGKAWKLSRYSTDELCGACREKVRDSQVPKPAAGGSAADAAPSATPPNKRFSEHDQQDISPRELSQLGRPGDILRAALALKQEDVRNAEDDKTKAEAADRIYATLAFAYAAGQNRLKLPDERTESAWDEWADTFARTYKQLRAVKVVEVERVPVLIVERTPVFAEMAHDEEPGEAEVVKMIIFRTSRVPQPQEVVNAYRQALSDHTPEQRVVDRRRVSTFDEAGEPCEVFSVSSVWAGNEGAIDWRVAEDRMVIEVRPRNRRHAFPPPELIGELYGALIGSTRRGNDGYGNYLADRGGGRPRDPTDVLAQCVAHYLRKLGIPPRKQVHELLNRFVLPKDRKLTLGTSDGHSNTFWESIDDFPQRVEQPLLRLESALHEVL